MTPPAKAEIESPIGLSNMILNTFFRAVGSVVSGFCRRRRDRPGTSLRTLCVAAFDFTARADGQRLGPEKRRALNSLLDLGALINDHFDEHRFCKCSYRRLRRQLAADKIARAVYRVYFRRLRRVERNRPRLGTVPIFAGTAAKPWSAKMGLSPWICRSRALLVPSTATR